MIKNIAIVVLFISLFACNSNEACLDVEKQTLYTMDNVGIRKLYLEEKGSTRVIKIEKKKGKEAHNSINLAAIDTTLYKLYELGDGDNRIDYFTFNANSTWSIDHISIGDAAPGELTISTDGSGKIFSTNKMCN